MAKTAAGRSAKKRAASDAGVSIRLGAAIKAVTAARAKLKASRTKASDKVAVDTFLDAAKAFLDVWKCQDKTMTRRF